MPCVDCFYLTKKNNIYIYNNYPITEGPSMPKCAWARAQIAHMVDLALPIVC